MSKTSAKRHMGRVAALDCVLCRYLGYTDVPAEVHHIREGQGMGQRSSDWLTIPVCASCHRGPQGIHGDQTFLRIANVDELDLLADTIRRLTT